LRELVLGLLQAPGQLDNRGEPLVLPPELGELPGVAERAGVEQLALDVRRAGERLGETVAEAQAPAFSVCFSVCFSACFSVCFWYFWRKRSTRPAVSISFCLPVKNGWQAEQMSVWISPMVDRVWNVFPQAHRTVAVA
jgi:hypothetical protein